MARLRLFYPQEPTKWTEELAKVYDRQTRQLEEHHANLRERDRQEEERAQKESFVNMIAKVAEFSSSASKLVKAHKAKTTKQKAEFNENYLNFVRTNPEYKKNLEEIYEANKHDAIKLNSAYEGFLTSEYKNGRFKELKYLDRFSTRKMFQLREATAMALAPTAIGDHAWSLHVNRKPFETVEGGVTEEELREAYKNNEEERNKWAQGELTNISNNKEFATKYLFDEYDRQTSTVKGVQKAKAAADLSRLREIRSDALIKTSGQALNPKIFAENLLHEIKNEEISGKYTQVEGGPTIRDQAEEAVTRRAESIGYAGGIPYSATVGLDEELTAAGSIAQSNLSKDRYNRIIRASRGGQSIWLADAKAMALNRLNQVAINRAQGIPDDDALTKLEFGGLVSQEKINEVRRIKVADQSQDVFDRENKIYSKYEADGKLHLKVEELKNHPNIKIRERYLPLAEEASEWIKDNPNEFSESSLNKWVFSARQEGSYNKPSDLNQQDNFVVGKLKEVTYTKLYGYLKAKKSGQNIQNIGALLHQDRQEYWVANGGGVKESNKKAPKPQGLFAMQRDPNGDYQWINLQEASLDINPYYNHTSINPNPEAAYEAKVKYFGNISKADRLKKVGGIYTKDQILGYIQNGYFNKDMKHAAAKDGLLPGVALDLAIAALNEHDPDFAAMHNLVKWEHDDEREPTIDQRINDGLLTALEQLEGTSQGTVIKQLQSLMRWRGFDSLTMNQRKRAYKILASVSPVTEGLSPALAKIQQQRAEGMSEEEIKEWWKLYRDTKFKENVEGGALDLQNIPIG